MPGIDEIKNTGLKATAPRVRILELFQGAEPRHLSAEDVYRVLTQFEQAGLLRRNTFETGKAVFELDEGTHHDHLVCLDCGRVEEFLDPAIEQRQHAIAKARGFVLQEHALALYANCNRNACPHRSPD